MNSLSRLASRDRLPLCALAAQVAQRKKQRAGDHAIAPLAGLAHVNQDGGAGGYTTGGILGTDDIARKQALSDKQDSEDDGGDEKEFHDVKEARERTGREARRVTFSARDWSRCSGRKEGRLGRNAPQR